MGEASQAGAGAPDERRGLRALLVLFVLASLAAGGVKLAVQRDHPPPYADRRWNSYQGWVAIDGHARRAVYLQRWFTGEDPGAAKLREALGRHHSTAIAIPAVVALLALPLGSIPIAFSALAGLAWLLQVLLVMRLAVRVDTRGDPATGPIAGILFAAHCLSARTVLQLLLDPFVALAVILAVCASLSWLERRSPASAGLLLLALVFGAFTKLSFVPLFALPSAALLAAGSGSRARGSARAALVPGLLLGAAPAALLAGYLALVGVGSSAADMRQFSTSWDLTPARLRQFGLEMALLVQAAPLLFLLRPRAPGPGERVILAAILLLLLPLFAFGLPAVPRLYLPVLGLGAALCAGRFAALFSARARVWLLLAYGVTNLLVAGLGIYRQTLAG